jgi:hypothetical protein
MPLHIDAKDIDLTNREHLHLLINEIEGAQNVERKRHAFRAFECQEGKQKDHVKDRLKVLYPQTFQKFRVGNVAAVNKIIKKKSKAYKTEPLRTLDNEVQTRQLNEIYDAHKFSRAFKEADRIFNLHKYVCLWLAYDNPPEYSEELKGRYYLQALAPYEYDIVADDKGNPLIFIMSYAGTEATKGADGIEQTISEDQRDTAAETKKYSFWSKDHFAKVITRGRSKQAAKFESVELKPNPIGRLPIAYLSNDTAADYPITSSLADKVIDWNVELSDLKTAAATQGHGQLVLSHPEGMNLQQLHMGMHTAINLPQSKKPTDRETKAEYISASPDLSSQLEILKFSLSQIMDDEGIVAKSVMAGGGVDQVSSGFDRLLREADVQDIIEDNQALYADCLEQDVYQVLVAYEDALNTAVFSSERINVSFEKPKVLITEKEVRENIKLDEELGLSLSYEKHMIINPNLSVGQAKEREALIQAEKEERANKMRALLGNGEEQDEDEEIENENE